MADRLTNEPIELTVEQICAPAADDHNCGCATDSIAAAHSHDSNEGSMMHNSIMHKLFNVASLDNLGMFASLLCVIHCLAMPFLIAMLPFLGLQFIDTHESHLWLAGLIWLFALFAIVPGYLKHRHPETLVGMILGLALVSFGALAPHHVIGHDAVLPIMVTGNLILAGTHWRNRRLFQCCEPTNTLVDKKVG